ncbi:MAG: sialate O-acetylesterase, partial [Rubripirellula sp.]
TALSTNRMPLPVARNAVPVFILAGQTNMRGPASVKQLKSLLEDPASRPKYAHLLNEDGKFRVRQDVWLVTPEGANELTVGLGNTIQSFGPELMIGNRLGDRYAKPVVLVRFTYGPWSLGKEGRPPSSGPPIGPTYQDLTSFVSEVRADLGKFCPACKGMKADVKGFFWLQGWNDLVNPTFAAEYETNLPNFFRDLRSDLQLPSLPIVMGELGQAGENPADHESKTKMIRDAQRAAAKSLANTQLINTATMIHPDDAPGPPFLYGGDARTFYEMGNAFGNSMIYLLER